ncbi:extracellular solute-binding protein [Haloarchaeobius amylolyticus]|uniref:extracellular solute-binding protein n=1 Tax=Haloarchaeobius amylolyticus TaxID=1198296 RepID=UPI002270D2D1|nr:extracellular solute-binding protein [Haloarchaeobius amylolyticus]
MSKQRSSRRSFLAGAAATGTAALAGCLSSFTGGGGGNTATIFHAGSLAAPFGDAEEPFEEQQDADVVREAKGSVGSTRKITEQGKSAEVLGVSDFRLIRDMVLPDYGEWYSIFATNSMAIAYTDESTGADEFSTETWWEVLTRDDVTFAHSDPAVDPNGYRSRMAMKLGAIEFEGERLYDGSTRDALIEQSNIPSGTETELIAQLESGELDYAWQYTSAGASHDVNVIELQPAVNLAVADQKHARHYAKATVEAGGNTYTGAPIAYGLTVPGVAENPDLGAQWVEFMASEEGKGILEDNGFSPVSPLVVPESGKGNVPENVMGKAEARSSLGPLEL